MTKQIQRIEDLTPDEHNANAGTERGVYMVEHSIEQYGAGRSILADKDGRVIAGNKTLQAAIDAGLEVEVVQTDGNKLVVVQREDLDLEEHGGKARKLAYADNRASQVGLEWNVERVLADVNDGVDLSGLWHDDELDELLSEIRIDTPADDPGAQMDKAQELQEVWQVQSGDVWEIPSQSASGKTHRLMCGDSTNTDDIIELLHGIAPCMMFCDPLYESPPDIMDALIDTAPEQCHIFVMGSDKQLVQISSRHINLFRRFFAVNMKAVKITSAYMPATMIDMVSEFLKGKTNFKNRYDAFSNYLETSKHLERLKYYTKSKQPSLVIEFIEHYTDNGDVVLDGFIGGGTTIVACEQTGRLCYGMEIEPKYCAVTLQRLADMGLEPRIVNKMDSIKNDT